MDNAVALVNSYLRLNGYFTVTEYPIMATARGGPPRTVTDIDVLAFRFPSAGIRPANGRSALPLSGHQTDPALEVPASGADMLVGEVKEGRAVLNAGATNPFVLKEALVRFGCCDPEEAGQVVENLIRSGSSPLKSGHRIRMVAFGATRDDVAVGNYTRISLGNVLGFLKNHISDHWEVLRHADTKDPAFGFLMTLEKALRDGVAR
jgi:hypothetical protein